MIDLLKDSATVIAPDTPGYGASDPLPTSEEGLEPYVEWLAHFIQSQGLKSTGLYGSATGAQIAIEFARTHPEMTDFLVLDNAVHFTADQRDKIMGGYFPDITPMEDGSHLQTAWEVAQGLYTYFPWYEQREENRISKVDPPLELLQQTALAYFEAGEDYARAYRAAFLNEDARNVQAVTVPASIIRWEGSILRQYADQLDAFDWPENIRMVPCGPSPQERFKTIKSEVRGYIIDGS
jgi:pimeloyl-ACP methyl ester carboxylesterase